MAGKGCRETRAAAVGAGSPANGPVCKREAAYLIGSRALHGLGESFQKRVPEAAIQLPAEFSVSTPDAGACTDLGDAFRLPRLGRALLHIVRPNGRDKGPADGKGLGVLAKLLRVSDKHRAFNHLRVRRQHASELGARLAP